MSQGSATANRPRTRRGGRAVPDLMAKLREAEIRARLREAREHAGLSRDKLADILTVHPKSIENYEKDRVPYTLLNAWAEATGTSVEWLLHGERSNRRSSDDEPRMDRIEHLLEEIRDLLSLPDVAAARQRALDTVQELTEAEARRARKPKPGPDAKPADTGEREH